MSGKIIMTHKNFRIIPPEWKHGGKSQEKAAKNLHFFVLPTYTRYNDQTPLSIEKGLKKDLKRDLLFFPLGYAHVISSIQTYTNHNVEVLDPYVQYTSHGMFEQWLDNAYEAKNLPDPDYLLLGGMSTSWPVIKSAVFTLQKKFPQAKIICGGTVANLHHELLLRELGVHVAVLGEADIVIVDLFRNLDNISEVQGISYLNENNELIQTPTPVPPDLNELPEPAFEKFDIEEYIKSVQKRVGYRGLPIATSTGCPYSCNFCYVPGGQNMRYLKPETVVDRIQYMKDQFQLDYVSFSDDICFVDKDWMWELGERLIKAKTNMLWNCNSRVNLFREKDAALLRLLRKAGLVRISFGIETGSPTILKNMGKTGASPEKAQLALRLARENNIRATASMLLGYPGETKETIWETVQFCKDNLLQPSFYLLQPFPGTTVYDQYVRPKYTEKEYLELLGDYREGEKLFINLTSISDVDLMKYKKMAEAEMKRFSLGSYMKYYRNSIFKQIGVDLYREARRYYSGSLFKTP
jgi:anaerobic magnesium-protoporphyrin IX monomethyl ester cyclase